MFFEYISDIGYNDFRIQIMSVQDILFHCKEVGFWQNMKGVRRASLDQRSRIVESILLGIPQPPVYVDDTDMQWTIVYGYERIDALYSFCISGMALSSLYFKMDQYEGRTFSSLSPLERNKILNTKITVNVINPGLSRQERFGVYLCLRNSTDTSVLRWCRKKIYPYEYTFIERLAGELVKHRNLSIYFPRIENYICHLLVGINYDKFMKSDKKHNLDAAVNAIIESYDFEDFIKDKAEDILRAFDDLDFRQLRSVASNMMIDSLFLAVRYHMRNLDMRFEIPYEKFYDICRSIPQLRDMDDSAESFCSSIGLLLQKV